MDDAFTQSGGLASTFSGTVTSPTFLGDLNGTINTVTTAVTKANATNDTTVATTAFVQNLIGQIPAGLRFEGTWDARTVAEGGTGNPPSSSPANGQFWIVSVDGSINLSGITDWKVGDWAIYVEDGAGTDGWQKVDNSSVLDGSGIGQTLPLWAGSGTSNTLTDSNIKQDSGGNIGIGPGTIVSPPQDLGLTIQSDTTTSRLVLKNTSTGVGANDGFRIGAIGADIEFETVDSGDYQFFTGGGAAKFIIKSSGNVGIGTTNPTSKLHVQGSATPGTYAAYIHNASGGGNVLKLYNHDWDTGDFLLYATNGGTAAQDFGFTVDGNARVNIGLATVATAATAADDLHLRSLGSNGITISSGNTQTGTIFFGDQASASVAGFRYNHNTGDMAISAEDNVTFACDNVGIGTTSPGEKLQVQGNIAVNKDSTAANFVSKTFTTGHAAANRGGSILFGMNDSTPTGMKITTSVATNVSYNKQEIEFITHEGAVSVGTRMKIDSLGNVGIGTTGPTTPLHVIGITQIVTGSDTAFYGGNYVRMFGDQSYSFRNTGGSIRGIINTTSGNFSLYNSSSVLVNQIATNGNSYFNGGNVGIGTTTPTEKLVVDGKVIINNANPPNNLAQLNIGYTGNGETRAIDIDGSWTGGESKSITFTYGSDAANMVGQISCTLVSSTDTRLRFGKLYYNGNSSAYTMELKSTSTTTANLTVAGSIQMADDTATATADKVGTQRYRETTGASYVDMVMRTSATTYEWINIVRNVWSV